MNKKIILMILVTVLFLMVSIANVVSSIGNNILIENLPGKNNNHISEIGNQLEVAEWTVMAYIAAELIEPYGIEGFLKMAELGSTDEVHITAQIDDSGDARRYYVTQGMIPDNANATMNLGETNMGDPQTLIDFASWSINNYPANRYCLVLVDHGGGWYGVCWDGYNETEGDHLDMQDLRYALSTITSNGENPIDLVCFDACVMAMLEVAYEIAPYALYMTASQSSINPSEGGMEYDKTLACLVESPTMHPKTLGATFVSNFSDFTLSTLNLSLINSLKDAVNDLGNSLQIEEYLDEIVNAIDESDDAIYRYELYQFVQFLQYFIDDSEIDIKTQNVMNLINITVTSNKPASPEYNIHGINIYIIGKYKYKYWIYDPVYENISFARDTQWDEFILWYLSFINTNPPEIPEINGPSSGEKGITYDYTFRTLDSDADYFYFYVDWGDGTNSGWVGPFGNPAPVARPPESYEITLSHTWSKKGNYTIKVKAKDIFDLESDWGYLEVTMPRTRTINSFFYQVLERFPNAFPLLRQLLGL